METAVGMVASFKGSGGRELAMTTVNALQPPTPRATSAVEEVECITHCSEGVCKS